KMNYLAVICLLYCYFFSNVGAGRFFLVETSLYLLLIFYVKNTYFKLRTSRKVIFGLGVTLLILYTLSIYFVNFRRGLYDITLDNFIDGNSLLLKQSIIYNVGAISALDYGL